MKKPIVIFDTNAIYNAKGARHFFGGRSDLERFAAVCEIVIPDTVISELRYQKINHLESKKQSFVENPLHALLDLDHTKTHALSVEDIVDGLKEGESVSYKEITLTKANAATRLRDMCLSQEVPFGGIDEGRIRDKGFKDAYILLTVEEYVETIDDEVQVFFICGDEALRMAAQKIDKLTVLRDFSEFENHNLPYFRSEYFLSVLSSYIEIVVTSKNIDKIYQNINDNWTILVSVDDQKLFVEVDFHTKDIIQYSLQDLSDQISVLKESDNIKVINDAVSELRDGLFSLDHKQMKDILFLWLDNNSFYWLATDDTKEMFMLLFKRLYSELDQNALLKFRQFGLYVKK